MKKRFKLILLILLFSTGIVQGQSDFREGYIITLQNDIIKEQIDYRSNAKNYESCIIKGVDGDKLYLPHEIKGFGYNNDKFFSSQVKENTFVEVLILGDMSLYKAKDAYFLKKDTAYFELKSVIEEVEIDGRAVKREQNSWRGVLTYLISDCLANANSLVSRVSLNEKDLTKLLIKYNKCTGATFKEFKASKPWTQVDLGMTVGLHRTEISTYNESGLFSYLDNTYNSIDPSVGVLLNISSPRLIEKFAFQSEIHFVNSRYSSLVEINGPVREYHDTYIRLKTLSIPLSVNYTIPIKEYDFYLQGGINFDYHLSAESKLLSERIIGNEVNTFPERNAFEINRSQIGYWSGIGVLKSYSNFKGSIAIRYFNMSLLNKTEGFTADNNRISINLILLKK